LGWVLLLPFGLSVDMQLVYVGLEGDCVGTYELNTLDPWPA